MATLPADPTPDDRRKAPVWWPWLLALAIVLLLLWLLLGRRGADNEASTDPIEETASPTTPDATSPNAGVDDGATGDGATAAGAAGATGAAITNAQDLYGESLASFVGRRVEIDDATVLSVTGDSTFYVGADGRRFLVALSGLGESAAGPGGQGEDGRFDIDTGDRVSIRGTVERFDAANPVFGRLSETDRTEGTTRGAYVNVTRAADVARR